MRDRLMELLNHKYDHFCDQCGVNKDSHYTESLADYLLENGVIVPPCKVGESAYFIIKDEISGENYITSQQINDVSTRGMFFSTSTLEENCDDFEPYSKLGKTVFLTKEEAEQALKGGVQE